MLLACCAGNLASLRAKLLVLPIRPADPYWLDRRNRADDDTKLGAEPNIAAPKVGPSPARQALEL
eukprot:2224234-Alexandrium_andersonii.AAC.1